MAFDIRTLSPEQLAALSPEQLAALSGNVQPTTTTDDQPTTTTDGKTKTSDDQPKEYRWKVWACNRFNIPPTKGKTFTYQGKTQTTKHKVVRIEGKGDNRVVVSIRA